MAVGCGIAVSSVFVGCGSVKYVAGSEKDNKIVLHKSDFEEQKFVVVNHAKLEAPIYLSQVDDGYLALSMLCTHLGCELKPTGTFMTCPCHGSEFSNSGEVLNGPAFENLMAFDITVVGEEILIDINKQ